MTEEIGDTRVQEAQRETSESALLFDKTRHGLRDLTLERVQREWQTSLMGYYQEIARYQHTDNLERVWYEEIKDGWNTSLDELQEVAYQDQSRPVTEFDADAQTEVQTTVNEPKIFGPEQLRAIKDKLDECYHELGFDEPPENKLPESMAVSQREEKTGERAATEFVEIGKTLAQEGSPAPETADD
jgi:hypothetical protein